MRRGLLARARYVARHLFLLWFLVALFSANLDGGPLDEPLRPYFGQWIERIGLRQNWSMFAPNPTHYGSFARAFHVTRAGREEIPITFEPPPNGWFFRIGYDRILKLHKKITVAESTKEIDLSTRRNFDRAYATALCRTNGLGGEIAIQKVLYYTPSPSRRLKGWQRMRIEEDLGVYPCP